MRTTYIFIFKNKLTVTTEYYKKKYFEMNKICRPCTGNENQNTNRLKKFFIHLF